MYVYVVETALFYLNDRFYSPRILKFINEDVILQKNGFYYCNNNPIRLLDPDGKQAVRCIAVSLTDGGGTLRNPSDEEIYFNMIQEHYPNVKLGKNYKYSTGRASITREEADFHNTLMDYAVDFSIGTTSFTLLNSTITTIGSTVLSGSLMFFLQDRIANGFHITAGDFEYHSFTYHVETPIYNEEMIYSIRIYSYSKETVMEFRMQYMSSGPYWFPSYQYDMIIIGGENGV